MIIIEAVKKGNRIRRKSWDGTALSKAYVDIDDEHGCLLADEHGRGMQFPFFMEDLMATDWEVVDVPQK